MYAMEVPAYCDDINWLIESPRPNELLTQIIKLKHDTSKNIKYGPVIKNLESMFWSSEDNKMDIINYTIQMIYEKNIYALLDVIDDQPATLSCKINILKALYKLPNPALYQEKTISTHKKIPEDLEKRAEEKYELAYWLNSKLIIKEEIKLKIRKHAYENQKKILDRKAINNKKVSLQEWRDFQLISVKYKKVVVDSDIENDVEETIKTMSKNIKTAQTRLALKEIVSNIRQSPTADIDELCQYKQTLEKYIGMLPEYWQEQLPYQEVIDVLCDRINLLREIDGHLLMDYSFFLSKDLTIITKRLQELQDKLNKPNSERHRQLSEEIEYLEGLIET